MKKKVLIIITIVSILLIGTIAFTTNEPHPYTICSSGSKEDENYLEYTYYLDRSRKYILKEKIVAFFGYETLSEAIENEQSHKEWCKETDEKVQDCKASRNGKIVHSSFTSIYNSNDKISYIEKMKKLEEDEVLKFNCIERK